MSAAAESIRREIARLSEFHQDELNRLGLRFVPEGVRQVHGTWSVPMSLGNAAVDADAVSDLLRVIRRSLEGKTSDAVSVFVDPDLITNAA